MTAYLEDAMSGIPQVYGHDILGDFPNDPEKLLREAVRLERGNINYRSKDGCLNISIGRIHVYKHAGYSPYAYDKGGEEEGEDYNDKFKFFIKLLEAIIRVYPGNPKIYVTYSGGCEIVYSKCCLWVTRVNDHDMLNAIYTLKDSIDIIISSYEETIPFTHHPNVTYTISGKSFLRNGIIKYYEQRVNPYHNQIPGVHTIFVPSVITAQEKYRRFWDTIFMKEGINIMGFHVPEPFRPPGVRIWLYLNYDNQSSFFVTDNYSPSNIEYYGLSLDDIQSEYNPLEKSLSIGIENVRGVFKTLRRLLNTRNHMIHLIENGIVRENQEIRHLHFTGIESFPEIPISEERLIRPPQNINQHWLYNHGNSSIPYYALYRPFNNPVITQLYAHRLGLYGIMPIQEGRDEWILTYVQFVLSNLSEVRQGDGIRLPQSVLYILHRFLFGRRGYIYPDDMK